MRQTVRRLFIAVASIALCGGAMAAETPPKDLDAYIKTEMERWRIPGLSIAIVKNDKILYAEGFGVRRLGEDQPVDADTIFSIASITKSITAAAAGKVVADGHIGWDDSLVEIVPYAQTSEPYLTQTLSLRDALSHRSGLSGGPGTLMFYAGFSAEETLRRMRHQPLAYPVRGGYAYNNAMFLLAGVAVEELSGVSWARYVERNILRPANMTRARADLPPARTRNVATPHILHKGDVVAGASRQLDNIAPAGAVTASANDMANWLRVLLNEGVLDETEVLPANVVSEMMRAQNLMRPASTPLPFEALEGESIPAYGLGLFTHMYKGEKIVAHTGSIDGMAAIMGLAPNAELGVIILTNLQYNQLRQALLYKLFDHFLFDKTTDYSQALHAEAEKALQALAEREAARAAPANPAPQRAPNAYIGRYRNDLYGDLTIRGTDDGIILGLVEGEIGGALSHWSGDVFVGDLDPDAHVFDHVTASFVFGQDQTAKSVVVEDFGAFARVPDKTAE